MPLLNHTAKTVLNVFAYLAIFTVFVLSSTIVLHELGHFIVGVANGCNAEIILLNTESFGTYTRLDCNLVNNVTLLYLSSFLLVIPFALSFLILKDFPEKYFGLMILGIGIFSAAHDITSLTGADSSGFLSFLVGTTIYTIGQFFLAEHAFVRFEEKVMRGDFEW